MGLPLLSHVSHPAGHAFDNTLSYVATYQTASALFSNRGQVSCDCMLTAPQKQVTVPRPFSFTYTDGSNALILCTSEQDTPCSPSAAHSASSPPHERTAL